MQTAIRSVRRLSHRRLLYATANDSFGCVSILNRESQIIFRGKIVVPAKRTKSTEIEQPEEKMETEESEKSGDSNKPWDDGLKRIFSARPQDFVDWLLPGAHFLESVATELKAPKHTVIADLLFKV